MKKLYIFAGLLICAASSVSAQETTVPSESIIDENKVWMFIFETLDHLNATYYRFNGTTEINDKLYHNLYLVEKEYGWGDESQTQESWNQGIEYINEIPEFDFENIKPAYYMRQDGDKYYTLWGNRYFSPEGDIIPGSWVNYDVDQYGSNIIESLVYDFSVEPGGSFYRIGGPDTEYGILNEAPKGYYSNSSTYMTFSQFNEVKVKGYSTVKDNDKEFTVQNNYYSYSTSSTEGEFKWDAVAGIGSRWGLAISGTCNANDFDSAEYHGLINVRTLEGEYIYGKKFMNPILFRPSGIGEISGEESEAEYYGIDGCKVNGNPAPGIYLERKGDKIRKVIIK